MKKKIMLFALLAAGIIVGYLSFITWAVGFLLARYLGSKKVGEPGRLRSYLIPLGKYKIHLHHWLLSSWAIILFALLEGADVLPSDLFYGFFGGIVFQGIYCYSDWYKILIPRRVQSLAVAENLAIEESASTKNFPETRTEIED